MIELDQHYGAVDSIVKNGFIRHLTYPGGETHTQI